MSNEETIEERHLPSFLDLRAPTGTAEPENLPSDAEKDLAPGGEFNLHDIEMATIRSALRYTDGNRTKAADLLGISRRTLQRKLKEISSPKGAN
jgi:DNA-binding NtrC family response regulator